MLARDTIFNLYTNLCTSKTAKTDFGIHTHMSDFNDTNSCGKAVA